MDEWINECLLGKGTYGTVFAARSRKTGELVAVKQMKDTFESWEACIALPEVKCLEKLNHQHIITLKKVVRENLTVYLLYEYMDSNLLMFMRDAAERAKREEHHHQHHRSSQSAGIIPLKDVALIMKQIVLALRYMHDKGFFHRDLKPENILMCGMFVKVADLGQAREIPPPSTTLNHTTRTQPAKLTAFVSTRWYRAPEVILGMTYGPAIDIWAVGVIVAELITLRPLVPGDDDLHQLKLIFELLGPPTSSSWPDGVQAIKRAGFSLDADLSARERKPKIDDVLKPQTASAAIDFAKRLLVCNPVKRLSAVASLKDRFLAEIDTSTLTMPAPLPPKLPSAPPRPAQATAVATTSAVITGDDEQRITRLIQELDELDRRARVLAHC